MAFSFGPSATGAPSGFGGFGATPAATTPAAAPAAPTPFAFGTPAAPAASTAAPATTGLFGAAPPAPPAPAPSAFGAFGKPATTATAPTGFSGFGTGLGASTAPSLGGFGGGAFGATAFGATAQQQQQQQQPAPLLVTPNYPQQTIPATPESTVASIRDAWDPNSPNCQFKHYFYNLVHPSEVKQYVRGERDDEKLWEHAVKNNPDPTCLVPALAVGFGDLQKRVNQQTEYLEKMKFRLGEIAITCDRLQQRHDVDNKLRLAEIKRKHQELAARVLVLMKQIHQLRSQGVPMSLDEDKLRGRLEELMGRLRKPGQYKSKVEALWRDVGSMGNVAMGEANGAVVADVEQLAGVLAEQQRGIGHVVEVLKTDQHDVELMAKHLKHEREGMYKDVGHK
ncbi:hypothetical protein AMAG_01830 [Allomyces macrogynus ATCC 38327]|uniref:Nucleoporin Nup54 alpha-helical domain-containing protein n=1 Tax=Allomyces macrogynus (strain ATCC 38327) TaxID=578462 RepID=A0A0L0S0W2_ALLM3|nr:hypothetical protein AMAG_01830 [Allomyces macrogynus ATCC 38327]|eukprot:KNE55984.1 hypothetical protein AMAG_01830 [Allomyces macrogynus ATCC 38327]